MREYYAYALIAGIKVDDARRMYPGFIRDMYTIRQKYDIRMMGGKIGRKVSKTLGL